MFFLDFLRFAGFCKKGRGVFLEGFLDFFELEGLEEKTCSKGKKNLKIDQIQNFFRNTKKHSRFSLYHWRAASTLFLFPRSFFFENIFATVVGQP